MIITTIQKLSQHSIHQLTRILKIKHHYTILKCQINMCLCTINCTYSFSPKLLLYPIQPTLLHFTLLNHFDLRQSHLKERICIFMMKVNHHILNTSKFIQTLVILMLSYQMNIRSMKGNFSTIIKIKTIV